MPLEMIWFSTARDQEALTLLRETWKKKEEGFLDLEIPLVFVSRAPGESPESDAFIRWVREKGIPLQTFSARRFKPELRARDLTSWRQAYDQEILSRLSGIPCPWIFLAGYMWIVSPVLLRRYRVINLHPAPPGGPKGTWQEVIWEILEKGLPEAGAQIHLVTEALDEGPALTYVTFRLDTPAWEPLWRRLELKAARGGWPAVRQEGEKEPLFARIRAEEFRREFPLILWTLKTLAAGRLQVEDHRVRWDGRPLPKGYCLNQEVEAYLGEG